MSTIFAASVIGLCLLMASTEIGNGLDSIAAAIRERTHKEVKK